MPDMISNKLSENARQILFERGYSKDMLNFQPFSSVAGYDPDYNAYLAAKQEENARTNGTTMEQLIAMDLVTFLDGKKEPKYAASAKELYDCITDYTRLNVLLNVKTPAELDEKRMKQIHTCISRLTGSDGVHPGFSAVLAAFNKDSDYAFCHTNEIKTLTHMVGHADALAADLEAISIADRNRTLATLTKRTNDLKKSVADYEKHVGAMMDEIHADGLNVHPDDIEEVASTAARLRREADARVNALVEANAKLEKARREEQEKLAENERRLNNQIAFISNAEKNRAEHRRRVASLRQVAENMTIQAEKAQDALDENLREIRDAEEKLAGLPARREKVLSRLTDAGLPKKSIRIVEEYAAHMNLLDAFEKNEIRVCNASAEDYLRLRTAEGRRQMIAEGGDAARMAKIIEGYAKLYGELHPKGFFDRHDPADLAVGSLIDDCQNQPFNSLDSCVRRAIRAEADAQTASASKNAGVKTSALSRILYDLRDIDADKEKITEELGRLKSRTMNLNDKAAFYKTETENCGKKLGDLEREGDMIDHLISTSNKECQDLKDGIEECKQKMKELDDQQEKNQADLDHEGETRRHFEETVNKLNGYTTELKEDEEIRLDLQGQLNEYADHPMVTEAGPDDRHARIIARMQALRGRSSENKGMHINTGAYNRMIGEIDKLLAEPDPAELSLNLQKVQQKAREYQIAKGTPAIGSRSAFGMMRLSYAEEIIGFCRSARAMLAETPAQAPAELAHEQKALAETDLNKDHPSLKTRMAAAAPRIAAADAPQAKTVVTSAVKAAEKNEPREMNVPV